MDKNKRKKLNYKFIDVLKLISFAFIFAGQIIPFRYSSSVEMKPLWTTMSELTFVGIGLAFTISGFLLTAHIHREYKYYKNFKLLNFWGRRAFKIVPLYLIVLFLGFIAIPNLVEFLKLNSVHTPNPIPFVSFTANFYMITNAYEVPYFIAVLWPICALLQVYIFWGILCRFFWKNILSIIIFGFIASILISFVLAHNGQNAYYYGVGCLPFFFAGAFGAIHTRRKSPLIERIKLIPSSIITVLHVITWALCFGLPFLLKGAQLHLVMQSVLPLLFTFIICEQIFSKFSPVKFKKLKLLNTIGAQSYGLYMYHGLAFGLTIVIYDTVAVTANGFMIHVAFPLFCFLITFFVSQFSNPLIEKPFIRMRRQFKRK